MRALEWLCVCAVAVCAAAAGAVGVSGATLSVVDFGAKGDGKTKDTAAIAAAFAACEEAGGCTVLFPAPGTYLTGSFNLTSFTTVQIDSGATVLASPDAADYPLIPALPSYPNDAANTEPRCAAVVHGPDGVQNVTITGGGMIDGNGPQWWVQKHLKPTKPPLFHVRKGSFITLTGGVTFQNSPWYTVHPWLTTDFVADGIRIRNPPGAPHTDGIDPDSCTRATIRNCDIATSDDHISVKSGKGPTAASSAGPCTDVLIENNVFGAGGGIAIGSETSGSVANVHVRGAQFTSGSVGNLVRIKSCPTYGGSISNVTYENITAAGALDVGVAVFIDMHYECQTYPLPAPLLTAVRIADVTVQGVVMGESGDIQCVGAGGCDVSLENLSLPSALGWVNCSNVHGTVTNVKPKPCYG